MAPDQQPTQHPSGIVTPEAVVLEFETAGVGSRGVAKFLDLLVMFAALIALVLLVTFGATAGGSTIGVVLLLLGVFLIVVGYPVIIEVLWHGKTLGKAAFGLRVITREGAPIKFRHAAVRGIIGLIEVFALPFIAVLSCASSRTNQRFGDMAGGTIVIRERKAASKTGAVTFPPPPGLEEYVRALDVAAVTSEQYQVIRSFLLRVFDLTPPARMALAVRLANPVAIELKHDPPPMVNPELFLACVASAYQLRHGGPAASWQLGGGAYSGYSGYGAYGPAPAPAGAASPGGGYPGGGYPGGGSPGGGSPGGGYPGGGYAGGGYAGGGSPAGGYAGAAPPGGGYAAGGYAAGGAPGAGYPGAPHPGVGQPGIGQPDIGQPGIGQSGIGQSGIGQPGIGQSGMGQLGIGQSGMGQPGAQPGGAGGTWYPGIPPRPDDAAGASSPFAPSGATAAIDPYATADESRPLPPPPRPADPWAPVSAPPTSPEH